MLTETNKRPASEQEELDQANKRAKMEGGGLEALASAADSDEDDGRPMTKARENRLEQNRKAARESRRRKKLMIEGKLLDCSDRRL
jgi:hypothetical protein